MDGWLVGRMDGRKSLTAPILRAPAVLIRFWARVKRKRLLQVSQLSGDEKNVQWQSFIWVNCKWRNRKDKVYENFKSNMIKDAIR